MAEGCRWDSCRSIFEGKSNVLWFQTLVASVAVSGNGEAALAIMAGAALSAFFHLCHGYAVFFDPDRAVMAPIAVAIGLGEVFGMAEYGIAKPLDLVRNIFRGAFVAANAFFAVRHAKSFHAGMASTAGAGFSHLSHSKVPPLPKIKDGAMADLAVVVVFTQVQFMAEHDRPGIFKGKRDILVLCRSSHNSCE